MTPQKRLLAMNNYFYRRGGAETIFFEHMSLLEGEGWDVVPFAMQHPDNAESAWSNYFVSEIEYGRQQGVMTKLRHAGEIIYSREAERNLSALIEKARPDIAHAHNIYHHLSPSVLSVLKKAGVPTVLTAHDLKLACPSYRMISNGAICEKCKGGNFTNVLLNRCLKGSVALSGLVMLESFVHHGLGLYRNNLDKVVVPSRFYRDKLIEWGWPADKLVYVPNFVEARRHDAHGGEGDYYLFAGRFSFEKGVDTLIDAAARARVKLVLAGTGPDEAALRAQAEAVGADVTFAGFVSGGTLDALIAGARALILPSVWYENAPVSVLEAYALGRPVIGADIGGIPELVRDGETGAIARSGDAEDLARVISAVEALGPQRRAEMGAAGREWVTADFSTQAYKQRMLDLYAGLGVR